MDFLQRKKYPINRKVFIINLILIGILMIISFIAAWAADEGTLGDGLIGNLFANLFYVLRFPTHNLLWPLMTSGNGILFILFFPGLIVNLIFYSILIERLLTIGLNFRKK